MIKISKTKIILYFIYVSILVAPLAITSSLLPGFVVPMPTLPFSSILIFSDKVPPPTVWNVSAPSFAELGSVKNPEMREAKNATPPVRVPSKSIEAPDVEPAAFEVFKRRAVGLFSPAIEISTPVPCCRVFRKKAMSPKLLF